MKQGAHATPTQPAPLPLSDSRSQVFYDADCRFCQGLLARYGNIFQRAGFHFRPLQSATGPFPHEEFMREMKLLRPDGRWLGGADAWAEMFRTVWWLRPIGLALGWPGVRTFARRLYGLVAANRHCLGGACRTTPRPPIDRWLPLVIVFLYLPTVYAYAFVQTLRAVAP